MQSILVSSAVFLVVFGGALAGMRLRRVLPQNQLGPEVKDIIQAGDWPPGNYDGAGSRNARFNGELFLSTAQGPTH